MTDLEIYVSIMLVLAIVFLICFVKYRKAKKEAQKIAEFENTTYYKSTHNSYYDTIDDKGKYGEYQIFKNLAHYESENCKFLFNVYLPTNNGKTSEIDVMLVCSKCIIVFESKNYSGWIFGNEYSKFWTQTLPAGGDVQKEHFYNPIMQNQSHIKWLKNLINEKYPVYSVIVFSDRCTLKNVNFSNKNVQVVNMCQINNAVWNIFNSVCAPNPIISDDEVKKIYDVFYMCTQVSNELKQQHIQNVKQEQK